MIQLKSNAKSQVNHELCAKNTMYIVLQFIFLSV